MKFHIDQDVTPLYVIGGYSVPDPKWKYEDKNGHQHYYDAENKLLTLNRQSETTMYCDDYGDEWEDTDVWYQCKKCDEIIKPGLICQTGPLYQYGKIRYFIDDIPVPKTKYMEEFKKEYERSN